MTAKEAAEILGEMFQCMFFDKTKKIIWTIIILSTYGDKMRDE